MRAIKTAEADPSEFLPVAYRDLDEFDGFVEHLGREVYDTDLARLLRSFLDDDVPRRLPSRAVHALRPPRLPGRLLEHTVAVATLAFETCALHRG